MISFVEYDAAHAPYNPGSVQHSRYKPQRSVQHSRYNAQDQYKTRGTNLRGQYNTRSTNLAVQIHRGQCRV
eukprot:233235-Rhodomonas_salina.1